MTLPEKLSKPKAYLITFLKWGVLGVLIGAWGGLLGAAFHHALHFVTHLRTEYTWLIFGLPVAGLLSVGIYTLTRQRSNRGTNEVIDAVLNGGDVSAYIAPQFFWPLPSPTCSAAAPVGKARRCRSVPVPQLSSVEVFV